MRKCDRESGVPSKTTVLHSRGECRDLLIEYRKCVRQLGEDQYNLQENGSYALLSRKMPSEGPILHRSLRSEKRQR